MSPKRQTGRQQQNTTDDQFSMEFAFSPGRLKFILIAFLGLYSLALGRVFYVQIIRAGDIMEESKKQHYVRIDLFAKRGEIFDRNGKVIAGNVKSISYAIDPTKVKNKELIAKALTLSTDRPYEYWKHKIDTSTKKFAWMIRQLVYSHPMLDTLRDPGLLRIPNYRRSYVYGSAASQVIGLTNIDNKGLAGIELMLDTLLRGQPGHTYLRRDATSRLSYSHEFPIMEAENGHAIALTLDIELQRIVEFELSEGIQSSGAAGGTVIAIEPSSGEILAMASWPTFDPNHTVTADPESSRLRGITDIYEPGSTFKLVTASAAIEEGIIGPDSMVNGMNGVLKVGDYEIIDSHPLGKVRFTQALEQSSNIVFAKLADKIDDYKFYKYARDFGFGIVLGIDLPGEVPGILKKSKQFGNTTKKFMAYGYEMGATALQVVNAYATIANNGVMMRPYVVRSISTQDGALISETRPQRIRSVVSEKTAKTLQYMLSRVVEYGTGKEAKIAGLSIAGKTGTAQQLVNGKYSKQDYTASFVGFFPADAPKVAMIVMLHKPQSSIYGGAISAPIFKKIAQKWITASRIPVKESEQGGKLLSQRLQDSALMPDIRGMNVDNARHVVHSIGLRLPLTSSGTILSQSVKPGAWIPKGSVITISTGAIPTSVQYKKQLNDSSKVLKQQKNVVQSQIQSMPNVKGMSVRRALSVLHAAGYKARVVGKGKITGQMMSKTYKKECILRAD